MSTYNFMRSCVVAVIPTLEHRTAVMLVLLMIGN